MKTIIVFLFFITIVSAMDREKYNQVLSLIQAKNYEESSIVLSKLKKTHSNDPEYYALILNYYLSKSIDEGLIVRKGEHTQEKYLKLYDSTKTNPVGVIEGHTSYNLDTLNKGINEFEIGLNLFENRLDLHIGLIHAALLTDQYTLMQEKMLNVISISKKIDNDWLWSFNEKYSVNAKDDFLNLIQEKLNKLFYKETAESDSVILIVSKALIKEYPDCIYGYNCLGVVSFFLGNIEQAKLNFMEAYRLDQTDILVIKNLAKINAEQGFNEEAIKYYKKIMEIGDEATKKWANDKIKLIEKE